jgi:hypothetical protein
VPAVDELVIYMPVIAFCATCNTRGTAASGKRVSTLGDEKAFG